MTVKITGLSAPNKNSEFDSLARYKNTTFHTFLIRGFFLYTKDVYGGEGGGGGGFGYVP